MANASGTSIINVCIALIMSAAVTACSGGFSAMPNALDLNGSQSVGALTPEQKAFAAFTRSDCDSCHGFRPGNGGVYVYDTAALVASGDVIPGDPDASPLFLNTQGGHHGNPMSSADQAIIRAWIVSLASPSPTPTPTPAPTPAPTPGPSATPTPMPSATPMPTPTPTPAPTITKDQAFTLPNGPNGASINSLISVNRCANCHYSGGATWDSNATNQLVIDPNDPTGNLSRLKGRGLTNYNGTLSGTLYQYASGHKTKSPAYTSQDLTYIKNWVMMP